MKLLVKLGPSDLNRQDEPKIEHKSQKRIMSLCAAATPIKKARMVSEFTLTGPIKERKPNMQTPECHGSEVFLCYTHAISEAKVSLTENINIHTCGLELDRLYTFPRD